MCKDILYVTGWHWYKVGERQCMFSMVLLLLLSYKHVLPKVLSALFLIQYLRETGCEQIFLVILQ